MAEYSYEDYLQNKERKSTSVSFTKPNVGYFKLADDGDEALVRFIYKDTKDFNLAHIHMVKYNGMYRRVMCLRDKFDSIDKCPLCAKGDKLLNKFYVKLIEYTKSEDGKIIATPKVWERPESFASTVAHYIEDYGDLRECVFKIRRIGKKGDINSRYDISYQNPMKYTEELGFVKDFHDFDDLDLSHHSYIKKSFDEITNFLQTGELFQSKLNTVESVNTNSTVADIKFTSENKSYTNYSTDTNQNKNLTDNAEYTPVRARRTWSV